MDVKKKKFLESNNDDPLLFLKIVNDAVKQIFYNKRQVERKLNAHISILLKENDDLKKQLNNSIISNKVITDENETLRLEISDLKTVNTDLRNLCDDVGVLELKETLERRTKRLESLWCNIDKLTTDIKKKQDLLDGASSLISGLEQDIIKKGETISSLQDELMKSSNQLVETNGKIATMEPELTSLKKRLITVEDEKLQLARSSKDLEQKVMNQAKVISSKSDQMHSQSCRNKRLNTKVIDLKKQLKKKQDGAMTQVGSTTGSQSIGEQVTSNSTKIDQKLDLKTGIKSKTAQIKDEKIKKKKQREQQLQTKEKEEYKATKREYGLSSDTSSEDEYWDSSD